jgi:hypothetical protein
MNGLKVAGPPTSDVGLDPILNVGPHGLKGKKSWSFVYHVSFTPWAAWPPLSFWSCQKSLKRFGAKATGPSGRGAQDDLPRGLNWSVVARPFGSGSPTVAVQLVTTD